MKLIILIVPGLVLVGMMMYFQSNGGKELDSYMKKNMDNYCRLCYSIYFINGIHNH